MALRITEEDRKEIKDEFLFDNEVVVAKYATAILEYWKTKELLAEKNIVDAIFKNYDRVETIAGNILFTLATMEDGLKPIQSVGGMIAGAMAVSDKKQDRINAMHTAMELLLVSEPFVSFDWSKNGHPMVKSNIVNEELQMRNIYLPLERHTEQHKELGSFNWKLSDGNGMTKPRYLETMDMQNRIPLQIKKLDEVTEPVPANNDFSKEGIKQRELANKQVARQYLADKYVQKKVYFNWSADYRGRIYSVGYYLNCQGNEVEKNMIEFYDGEALDFHGVQQLKKSIASAYGLDKKTDAEKLQWFIKNQRTLHLRARNAKEPYTFQALYKAWKQYREDPTAKITTPVELDATNSFAQFTSVLLGKRSIAETCNAVNADGKEKIADLYQLVADKMSDIAIQREYVKVK